jgi:hypothetical protein
MQRFEIEIPEDLARDLESLPPKPGSWFCPEIDKILLDYGGKKRMKDLAAVINKRFGLNVTARQLQYRYESLLEGEQWKSRGSS